MIMGYFPEEIIGRHYSLFYTEEARRDGAPDRALAVAAKKGKYEDEVLHVRKDKSRLWVSILIEAIHDETGNLIGFAKITRDMTERREAEERLREPEQPVTGDATETIFVVEDDPDVREYVVETLRDLRYRVLEAANGEAALRMLERQWTHFDLLLTDVVLPGMNGRQLADALRRRNRV
jgi:PAS domain S-box-containing protein